MRNYFSFQGKRNESIGSCSAILLQKLGEQGEGERGACLTRAFGVEPPCSQKKRVTQHKSGQTGRPWYPFAIIPTEKGKRCSPARSESDSTMYILLAIQIG